MVSIHSRVLFILSKKVMTLKFADHLSKKDKRKLKKLSSKNEQLSLRDIEILMDKNKRGLHRRKEGAWG